MSEPVSRRERSRFLARRSLRWLSLLWADSDRLLTVLAIIIGTITGFGAIGFSWLVEGAIWLYFEVVGTELHHAGLYLWLLPLLPVTGALLTGFITYYFAPEAEGHGVPEVMDAMAQKGGRIRPRVAGAKAVASALTIGSGGSAGTEGPIIQIGAAIGSGFGQWLRVSLSDIQVLIGCGAAAGIASVFNAPIAGVLFAVEVLLRDVSLRSFVPIIVAAVFSSTVTQAFHGANDAIFSIPSQIGSPGEPAYVFTLREFGNYLVLGLICGVVAYSFIKALYFSEDFFRTLPVHRILRPALGALVLGVIAVGTTIVAEDYIPNVRSNLDAEGNTAVEEVDTHGHPPAIMGNGYPIIRRCLEPLSYFSSPSWGLGVLLLLLVGKILATCLSLGSGGSGGVFAPSLFMGATAGAAFGVAVNQLGIFGDISPGAYALVGMAAVVASSIHAPLTATLIIFELTRDYKVIIPIMMASVAGLAVARALEPASIYTLKLLRRGVRIGTGDLKLLQRISVRDIPRVPAPTVTPKDAVDKLVRLMRTTTANDFVVVGDDGKLAGMVLGDDLRTMLLESDAIPLLTVSDIFREDMPTVTLDETLDVVLNKFAGKPMQSLPVRDPSRPERIAELVTRAAVMNRYHQAVNAAHDAAHRAAAKR